MNTQELISRRINGQKDNCHLALSIEGGVMRGSVTAGMVEDVNRLGLRDIFDSVWGISIGSINAAYLVAGNTDGKSALYAKAATSQVFYREKKFIQFTV